MRLTEGSRRRKGEKIRQKANIYFKIIVTFSKILIHIKLLDIQDFLSLFYISWLCFVSDFINTWDSTLISINVKVTLWEKKSFSLSSNVVKQTTWQKSCFSNFMSLCVSSEHSHSKYSWQDVNHTNLTEYWQILTIGVKNKLDNIVSTWIWVQKLAFFKRQILIDSLLKLLKA